jgi:uncharacterized protein
VILLDTSGVLAALDRSQEGHGAAARALQEARGPLLLSPFVLAELDYLLQTRVSVDAAVALLHEVARGAYQLEPFDGDDIAAAARVIERHRDLGIGLADASIAVLASRYDVTDVLTLDERHFRALRGPNDRPFRLLPADARA